jgi:NADH pyrophosphatase NudC (nudix superfamily)
MPDLDMLVDRLDDAGHPIGSVPRRSVFTSRVNFGVVHVFLFNTRQELLLQQIAPGLRHAGQWGSSVAGYVASGETFEMAALRKLDEELGLWGLHPREMGMTTMLDRGCKKFIGLFGLVHDGSVQVDPHSASQVEFVSLPRIDQLRRSGARPFTETFLHLIDFAQSGGITWPTFP